MKQPSAELVAWLDLAKSVLSVLTLVAGLTYSIYRGVAFLDAKTEEAQAARLESEARAHSIDTLTRKYLDQIASLDAEIDSFTKKHGQVAVLSAEDMKEVPALIDSIRKRQQLLEALGSRIVELHNE